jgi:aminodeoxyfutalosine synthase
VVNRHINYSNVCVGECSFCAFARRPGQQGGYTLSLPEIFSKTSRLEEEGVLEIHLVGSTNPDIPYRYYLDLVAGLRSRHPGVTIKAFSAVEIAHMARCSGRTTSEVLRDLKESGSDALAGGGAEIFADRVRNLVCPTKIPAEAWLAVHREAHRLGLRSNATMLYGHVETIEERVDHLLRLRSLQEETGGFLAFIPLPFHPENTALSEISPPTLDDHLRTIAVSRLLLPNVEHIKCYWIACGIDTARLALGWGADDLDGTVKEERIYHAAGAKSPGSLEPDALVRLIREAGREPVARDGLYRRI